MFLFKPYDSYMAKRIINGNQRTITFHVDDILSSRLDKRVNNDSHTWLDLKFGQLKKVTVYKAMSTSFSVRIFISVQNCT